MGRRSRPSGRLPYAQPARAASHAQCSARARLVWAPAPPAGGAPAVGRPASGARGVEKACGAVEKPPRPLSL
eukprot:scaffold119642_cov30-Tisochrysis_lutea.AAC.3